MRGKEPPLPLLLFSILSLLTTATIPLANAQSTSTICSCSPTAYQFQISLNNTCDSSTLTDDQAGIDDTLCISDADADANGANSGGGRRTTRRKQLKRISDVDWKRALDKIDIGPHLEHAATIHGNTDSVDKQGMHHDRRLQSPEENTTALESTVATSLFKEEAIITHLTSILFLEIDSTTDFDILNQDSTYFQTALPTNSIINYTSISSNLNASLPIEDQMEYVPGGVMLLMFGMNEEEEVVQSTVAWSYGMEECGVEPLGVGDSLGWIVVNEYTPAILEFCPATKPPPHKLFSKSAKNGKSGKMSKMDSSYYTTGGDKSKSGKRSSSSSSSTKSSLKSSDGSKSGKVFKEGE